MPCACLGYDRIVAAVALNVFHDGVGQASSLSQEIGPTKQDGVRPSSPLCKPGATRLFAAQSASEGTREFRLAVPVTCSGRCPIPGKTASPSAVEQCPAMGPAGSTPGMFPEPARPDLAGSNLPVATTETTRSGLPASLV
jgi:hypothetical protein